MPNKKNCIISGSSKTIYCNKKENEKKNSNVNNLKKNKHCQETIKGNTIVSSNHNRKDKKKKSNIFL